MKGVIGRLAPTNISQISTALPVHFVLNTVNNDKSLFLFLFHILKRKKESKPAVGSRNSGLRGRIHLFRKRDLTASN